MARQYFLLAVPHTRLRSIPDDEASERSSTCKPREHIAHHRAGTYRRHAMRELTTRNRYVFCSGAGWPPLSPECVRRANSEHREAVAGYGIHRREDGPRKKARHCARPEPCNVRTARGGIWTHVQVVAMLHPSRRRKRHRRSLTYNAVCCAKLLYL